MRLGAPRPVAVTDDLIADHEVNPLRLGDTVAIDVEFIRGEWSENRFRRRWARRPTSVEASDRAGTPVLHAARVGVLTVEEVVAVHPDNGHPSGAFATRRS